MDENYKYNIIDGFGMSKGIQEILKKKIDFFFNLHDVRPHIAIILVGNFAPSEIYVKQKQKVGETLGITADVIRFNENVSENNLLNEIEKLNNNKDIHGIMVQMPLPKHLNSSNILLKIFPDKDIDGLHPFNAGLLHISKDIPYSIEEVLNNNDNSFIKKMKILGKTLPFIPCTPLGCMYLIDKTLEGMNSSIIGKNVAIIGNSNLVSKPMARLLLQSGATTTTIHSRSMNFDYIIENADVIISATGMEQKFKKIKKDAILIDVGIRKIEGQNGICGDLNFQQIVKTNKITPVPRGVGPMTVVSLMVNSFLSMFKNI